MDSSSSSATITCLLDPKPVVPPASFTIEPSRSTYTSPPVNSVDRSIYIGVLHCMWYGLSSLGMLIFCCAFVVRFDIWFHGEIVDPPLANLITAVQRLLMWILYYYRRHSPYRCIGSVAKSITEVILVSAALVVRQWFGYDINHLLLLTGFTLMVHGAIQFMHVANDIGVLDALLGVLMQVVMFTVGGEGVYISTAIYACCVGVILYGYASYSAPALPVLEFKNLEIRP